MSVVITVVTVLAWVWLTLLSFRIARAALTAFGADWSKAMGLALPAVLWLVVRYVAL